MLFCALRSSTFLLRIKWNSHTFIFRVVVVVDWFWQWHYSKSGSHSPLCVISSDQLRTLLVWFVFPCCECTTQQCLPQSIGAGSVWCMVAWCSEGSAILGRTRWNKTLGARSEKRLVRPYDDKWPPGVRSHWATEKHRSIWRLPLGSTGAHSPHTREILKMEALTAWTTIWKTSHYLLPSCFLECKVLNKPI